MAGKQNRTFSPVTVIEVLAFLRGEMKDLLRQGAVIDAIGERPQLLQAAELAELILINQGALPPCEPAEDLPPTPQSRALIASLPKRGELTLLAIDEVSKVECSVSFSLHGWRKEGPIRTEARITPIEGVREYQQLEWLKPAPCDFTLYGFLTGLPAPDPGPEFAIDLCLPVEVICKPASMASDGGNVFSLAAEGANGYGDAIVKVDQFTDAVSTTQMPSLIVSVHFAKLDVARQRQTVMLELLYEANDQGKKVARTLTYRTVVEREGDDDWGSLVITDFPEPEDACSEHAKLMVRLARPEELYGSEVSDLLDASPIEVFPVTQRGPMKVWAFEGQDVGELLVGDQPARVYAMIRRDIDSASPPKSRAEGEVNGKKNSAAFLTESQEAKWKALEDRVPGIVNQICWFLEKHDLEDINQEVVIHLSIQIAHHESKGIGYFIRAIVNKAIELRRREVRRLKRQGGDCSNLSELVADRGELNPHDALLRKEDALLRKQAVEKIRDAASGLSEQQRKVVEMRLDGLSYEEIAEVLEITKGNACRHLSWAAKKLKKIL